MNFRQKLLAYSAAVTAAIAVAPDIHAGESSMDFKIYPVTSEYVREYWPDYEEMLVKHGELEPAVWVARVGEGDKALTVTTLSGAGACGIRQCPVRVFREGKMVADLWVCSNANTYAVNGTGSVFFACDEVFPISQP